MQLYYRTAGDGPDTVVMVHGGHGLTHDYFFDDLAPMAERHTLLFYDQRGAGRSTLVSDSTALDAQRFVDDLEAVRRHVRCLESFEVGEQLPPNDRDTPDEQDAATRQRMEEWMAARTANVLHRSRGDFCAGTPESRRNKIQAVDRYVVASLGN